MGRFIIGGGYFDSSKGRKAPENPAPMSKRSSECWYKSEGGTGDRQEDRLDHARDLCNGWKAAH